MQRIPAVGAFAWARFVIERWSGCKRGGAGLGAAAVSLALLLVATGNVTASTFTWTGAVSGDWFTAGNWSPAGVPGTNDIVNVASGSITLTNPIVINAVFNWTGGSLTGDGIFVTANGAFNISGTSGKSLQAPLTNAGALTWTGTGSWGVANNNATLHGAVWNLAGGVFNIGSDANLNCACYGNEFINNAGTLEKTAGTGTTYISVLVTNTGSVQALSGTLNLNDGGGVAGTFSASSGTSLNFSGGNFYVGVPTVNGPGTVAQTGGTMTLSNEAVANLQYTSGTLALAAGFEGGSITNLTISGVTLSGTNQVTGTMNWLAGTVAGPLTVAGSGTLNLGGSGSKQLQSALTNGGLVSWTGTGNLGVANNLANFRGAIWNLAGGTFDIATDQNINCACYGNEFFNNAGLLEKTAGSGTTYIGVIVTNTGAVEGVEGALNFNDGGSVAGSYTASSGASVNFNSGFFEVAAPTVGGAGTVAQTGGTLTLTEDTVTNLALNGGTLVLGPGFQGGTITNLTITAGTLTGTNMVTGTLNWQGGTIAGPVTVAHQAALNLSGSSSKTLYGALTNLGTVTWTGSGALSILNNLSGLRGEIWNQAGGIFNIATDENINCGCYGYEFFNNAGTLEKTAGAGATYISVLVTNTGTVEALSGTLNFNNGGGVAGVYDASSGAAINFTGGTFAVGAATVNGPGAVSFTGGTLMLLGDLVANLQLTGGSMALPAGFQGGTITNLTIAGITLTGSNVVTGTLTLQGGTVSGPLTIANHATLNWTNGTVSGPLLVSNLGTLNLGGSGNKNLDNTLTNFGTVTWTGTGSLNVVNNLSGLRGAIWNMPSGVFNIATDENINCGCYGYEFFNNAGTLEKTAGLGATYISVIVTNSGTVEALSGTLNFNNGGSLDGTYGASSGTAINFAGGSFVVEAPTLNGPGPFAQTGGTLTFAEDLVTNLALTGGTLVLPAGFQGGTITNLTIAGVTLNGANVVTGTLNVEGGAVTGPLRIASQATVNWGAGTISGPVTVSNQAALNVTGTGGKTLENALTNFGTLTITGIGNLAIVNNLAGLRGAIWNTASGLFDIAADVNISCGCYGYEFINNQGIWEKTAGAGTTYVSVNVTNTATVEALSGTLNFNNGGNLGGIYTTSGGAALNFTSGTFEVGQPMMGGAGPISFTGGTMLLEQDTVSNLDFTGGTVLVAPSFQGGMITNLAISGSTLGGTNVVAGTLTWTAGTIPGPLTVASNGALAISGSSAKFLEGPITNYGVVAWGGTGNLDLYNNNGIYKGAINNEAGGLFRIENNQTLACACFGYESFLNEGTVEKSVATNTSYISVPFTNMGVLSVDGGTLQFNGNPPYAQAAETLDFSVGATNDFGRAVVNGPVSFDGTLSVHTFNGYTPKLGDAIPLMGYTSHAGSFSSLSLPPVSSGQQWQLDYGALGIVLRVVAAPPVDSLAITGSVTDTNGKAIAGATVYAFVPAASFTNAITNGSFEQPGVGNQPYTNFNPGSTFIPGWTVFGPGAVDISGPGEGQAEDGTQFWDGTGNLSGQGGGISQTFPTTVGATYKLSFFNGYRVSPNQIALGVTVAGISNAYAGVYTGLGGFNWTPQAIYFTAGSSSETVTFQVLTTYNSDNDFVDNVQVTPPDYGRVLSAVTDSSGHYSIAVANGSFQVGVSGLNALGFNEVNEKSTLVTSTGQTVDFTAQPLSSAQIFTITTSVNPPGAGTATGGGTFAQGTTATVTGTPITTTLPYLFGSWTENGVFQSGSSVYGFSVNHDRNLVANFVLPLYTIAATNNPGNGGTITGAGSFTFNTTNPLTANPNFGFAFTNWTQGTNIVGSNPTLNVVALSNTTFSANYTAINLSHAITLVTTPPGIATPTGAATYTNGQTATFTTPMAVTNPPYYYTFYDFTLSNTVVSYSTNFSKTFSTLDATNLQYVAIYNTHTILPLLASVSANYVNPVPATTNFQLTLEFDRSMNTNIPPVILLTNSAVVPQPAVKTNGAWTSTYQLNDTYHTPPITFAAGMDGAMQLFVSAATDAAGQAMVLTNPTSYIVEATPPPTPALSLTASNSSSATVSWTSYSAPADLAGFRIYLATTNYSSFTGGPLYTAVGSSTRSYQIGGLGLNTNYYIAVQAVDGAGNALSVATPLVVRLPSTVPPPVAIQVTPTGGSSATISWTGYNTSALFGFTGFYVYYQQANFASVSGLTPQATVLPYQTSFQVTGLDRTKTTYFAVVGYNNTNGLNPGVTTASWSDPYAGTIGTSLSLGGAGQTVNIYHSITVASNATLTVQPGTTLLFAPGTGLTVQQGALAANGTALQPVIFDSANDTPSGTPAAGDWDGITLGAGAGASSLQFVEVRYGKGLTLNGCAPAVQAFTATANSGWGLGLSNGASLTTSAALLNQNGIGAAQFDNSLLTVQNSVLQNNNTNAWAAGTLQMNASSDWWGTPASSGVSASLAGSVSFNNFLTYEPLLTPAIGTTNGATQVGTSNLALDLACRTAESMRLSEDFSFGGVFFTPFTNQTVFALSPGGGTKHIFAQFRSITGQTNAPLELDVNYITAGPVINSFSIADGQTLSRPVTVTGSATAILGVQDMEFYLDGVGLATNAGGSFSYYFDVRGVNNAVHQVVLLARDTAGNVATLEEGVIVAVTPPPAPIITSPNTDYITNNSGFAASGTAEPRITVQLTANGSVLGTTTANATNGSFAFSNITLFEGANNLVAIASDSTGSSSSTARHITVETIPPAQLIMNTPVYTPGTGLFVSWQFPTSGKQATVFQLFWGTTAFATTNQAAGHSIPLSGLSDTLEGLANGTYYFGVVGFDSAGNPSPLSALVSAVYDATPPALNIGYGKPSPVGAGPLSLTLTSSKALAGTPSLTIQPAGASSPILLSLTNVALNTWQSTFVVSSTTPSGNASVQSAAQDQVGNVFNGAPAGAALTIDTTPPTGAIVTVPTSPVQTTNSTNVSVSLTLSKLSATTPTLMFQAPIGSKTPITLSGSGSNWNGIITLTSAMANGFGKFLLSAQDSVGNVGTNITSGGQLELYNTPLPTAPPDPTGLTAVSLPGGYLRLSWNSVSNAQIYRLYREAGANFTTPATLDLDNLTSTVVTDLPPADGFWAYAVSASRLGSESGFANALIALSDRTPPPAPTNVQVALGVNGLQVTWQQPAGEIPNHYNIYRNGVLVGSSTIIAPVIDYPPKGTNVYVVDSSDLIGNQNPSLPATNVLLVSPIASLNVTVTQGQAPALSWISTDASATGFNVYRNNVKQNASPLTVSNYTDALPLADATTYAVTAVNASSQESPPRLVNVYPLGINALINPPNGQILINYFDNYQITITNLSSAAAFSLAQLSLTRSVNGVAPLTITQSAPLVIGAGAASSQSITVPEATVPAAQALQLTATAQNDNEGNTVVYKNSYAFTNFATPSVEVSVSANQLPLAGGLNSFQAQIFNLCSTPIQVVTARGDGAQPGDIYISVRNSLGQEVSRTAAQVVPPGTIFLADSSGYSQIAAGGALNLTISNVLVPAALTGATNTTFVVVVSNIYSQIGTPNQVISGPLTGSMVSSSLAEPPYYGTAQTDFAVYTNDQPINITGQAISYSTGLPVPNAPLTIGFATRGYHWSLPVTADGSGNFQYTYNPAPGFEGTLSIWAAHPLVVDQLNQASVIIYRAYISPGNADVEMSKNGTITFNVQLINPGDVPLTDFQLSAAASQVVGTNTTPISSIHATLVSPSPLSAAANSQQTVTLQLSADANAPSSAQVVLSLKSAEGAIGTLNASLTLLPAVPVINIVSPAVGYVELNVNRGEQKSAQVTFMNSGLTTLRGITIQPPTNVTWMALNLPTGTNGLIQLPDLPQGQSNTFTVVFTPPTNTDLAQFQDDLVIQGTNLSQPYRVNLYATVTSELTGSVQFQVEDFLANYLSGASVRLANNLLQTSIGPFSTDTNGIVTITNLEEGVWNWQAAAPGCQAVSGTVTILADQTVYQNPVLSRSLVTINFSVVPVPFTDQYQIQVEQTFSTFVPVPELVVTPAYTTFSNVTPGFQASFNVTAKNEGLIQITDINITGQQDNLASLTPLITYMPVLLPQQSVDVPFVTVFTGTNTPSHQGLFDGCLPGGGDFAAILGAFMDGLAGLLQGNGLCQVSSTAVLVAGAALCGYEAALAASAAVDIIAAPLEAAASYVGCLIGNLLGDLGGGGGGGAGIPDGPILLPEGNGCLAPDTAVLMADGTSKPICQIQTNDVVRTGLRSDNVASVRGVYVLNTRSIEQIDFACGHASLLATDEHFFWVDGKGWTAVSRLHAGDWLFDSNDQRVQIAAIKKLDHPMKVYTLKLFGDVAFYADSLLTHEMCGPPPEPTLIRTVAATKEVAK